MCLLNASKSNEFFKYLSCSKAPNKGVMSEGSRLCPGHQEPAHWAQGSFSLGRHLIGEQSGREIWHSGVRRMQGFSPFGQRSHSCFLPGPWSSPHPSHCRPRCTPHPASPASPSLTQPHPDTMASLGDQPPASCLGPFWARPFPSLQQGTEAASTPSPSLFQISFMHSISHICKT